MFGLGTIINVAAIICGGLLGMLIGGKLPERFQKLLEVALGLSVLGFSFVGLVAEAITVTEDGVTARGTYTMIFSLVLGALVGEFINLDGWMERFGNYLKRKTGSGDDNSFVHGFLTASFTVCIGAMAIMGAIEDGVRGDYTILLTKSILDFFTLIVMASAMGKGCIFSAIPVAIAQGSVTIFAKMISPLLTELALSNLSMVGSLLIVCVSVNLLADGKFRIKVANLLPAIVFAVAAAYIPFLD